MKLSPNLILTGVFGLVASPVLAQGSPWLPVPKTGSITITQVSQEATHFYRGPNGTARGAFPYGKLEQNTTWFTASYGIADAVAVDARIGRSAAEAASPSAAGTGPPPDEDGSADMSIGVTWRFVDEDTSDTGMPSVAVRVGMIRAGDYDVGTPTAIGDGGDGFEASLLVGKVTGPIAVSAEFGIKSLNNDIPQATTLAATAHWVTPVPGLSVRAQYYSQGSDGSLNIGTPEGPPAHPDRFPQVAEEVDRISVGATYSFGALSVGVDRFDTRDGRNTGDFDAWAASVSYSFDLFRPN